MSEIGVFAKQVALDLNVNPSTLRRWCKTLEEEGYEFEKNEQGNRIYFEKDIRTLEELKKLMDKSVAFSTAIQKVAENSKKRDKAKDSIKMVKSSDRDMITVSRDDLKEIVRESVKQAIEEERESMFLSFERKMNDVVERRDRQLMSELRMRDERNEHMLLEVAAAEEKKEEKENMIGKFFKGFSEKIKFNKTR